MAARTRLRASAAAASPVSRTRHQCGSAGRARGIAFTGFLNGPVRVGPGEPWPLCAAAPGEGPGDILNRPVPVAWKIVLQVAVRDIGQLTDF
jgi:hypothetical protein